MRGASDNLHIKAGDVFRARIHGKLVALTKQALTPRADQIDRPPPRMTNEDDKARIDKLLDYDLLVGLAWHWALPRRASCARQRSRLHDRDARHPLRSPHLRKLHLPAALERVAQSELRDGARHRWDRLRLNLSRHGGAGQLHQPGFENRHILTLENPIEVFCTRTSTRRSRNAGRSGRTPPTQDGFACGAASGSRRHHDRRATRRQTRSTRP